MRDVTGIVRAILLAYVFITLFPALFSFSNATQQYNKTELDRYSGSLISSIWFIAGAAAITAYLFAQVYTGPVYDWRTQWRAPASLLFFVWIPALTLFQGIASIQRPDESQLSVWIAVSVTAIITLNTAHTK